jgi:hypothetical protein
MEYRTIGYNGVSRWCPNLKCGRRGLWWLDSRQDSEHSASRRVEKDEAGCFHRRQASRHLRELAQQARRRRRNSVVDLASRCEIDRRQGQSLFTMMLASVSLFLGDFQVRFLSTVRVHTSYAPCPHILCFVSAHLYCSSGFVDYYTLASLKSISSRCCPWLLSLSERLPASKILIAFRNCTGRS